MKKLMFVALALVGTMAVAADATTSATPKSKEKAKTAVKAECAAATAEKQCEAKACEAKACEAKACGTKAKADADRKAKYAAAKLEREKKAAEKAGISVEEYRAQRKLKNQKAWAKRLGMDVDEYLKLSDKERAEKITAWFNARKAAKPEAAKSTATAAPAATEKSSAK